MVRDLFGDIMEEAGQMMTENSNIEDELESDENEF